MTQEELETKTAVLASHNILLASAYGDFLSWGASEQENNSRLLKRIFDEVAAQINRRRLGFFGVEFTAEVIVHTDATSVFIALGLVYRADADPECVQQTVALVKKLIIDTTEVLELVMREGNGDAAKIAVVVGKPNESVKGSIVCAEKNVVDLVDRVRKIMTRSFKGGKVVVTVDGDDFQVDYRETGVPMVQDVAKETELVTILNVSDETETCAFLTQDGRRIELDFSEAQRWSLCDAQRNRTLVEVTYRPKIYWKNGRQKKTGGVVQSVAPNSQGSLGLLPMGS